MRSRFLSGYDNYENKRDSYMRKAILLMGLALGSCSQSHPVIDANLDSLVGMEETVLVQIFGTDFENTNYTQGNDKEIIFSVVRFSRYHWPEYPSNRVVYSQFFPEGISLTEDYKQVEFLIRNKHIISWVGYDSK